MRLVVILVIAAACGAPSAPRAPTTGSIAGQVRDQLTGEPVQATLTAHDSQSFIVDSARTGADGDYAIANLPPGTYDMVVVLSGTTMQLTGIPVRAGRTTAFDVPVDVGAVEVEPVAFAAIEGDDIRTYQPPELAHAAAGRLEGTVTDANSLERVPGAVVVATSDAAPEVLTGVSDDRGRYRFDDLPPGVYTLSAFYQVARRGQIEVRRSGVPVDAQTAVIVPLFVEVTGTE